MKPAYEPGMRIIYNAATRCATVTFRGRINELPGLYADEHAAVVAGEDFCRKRGWGALTTSARSLLPRHQH
jgi:hypothetical protein